MEFPKASPKEDVKRFYVSAAPHTMDYRAFVNGEWNPDTFHAPNPASLGAIFDVKNNFEQIGTDENGFKRFTDYESEWIPPTDEKLEAAKEDLKKLGYDPKRHRLVIAVSVLTRYGILNFKGFVYDHLQKLTPGPITLVMPHIEHGSPFVLRNERGQIVATGGYHEFWTISIA